MRKIKLKRYEMLPDDRSNYRYEEISVLDRITFNFFLY